MEVEYGPKRGVSNSIKTAQIIGSQVNPLMMMTVTTLLNIRSIDGRPPRAIGNLVDVQALANEIGDDGLDTLGLCHAEYFPAITRENLPVLKKNLRNA